MTLSLHNDDVIIDLVPTKRRWMDRAIGILGATMADILKLNSADATEIEARKRLYRTLNIDPSNVVFAPSFHAKAQEAYKDAATELPEAC